MTPGTEILRELCNRIAQPGGRRIIAIDGVDGAGKTVFAGRLSAMLVDAGHSVIQASVDGFHNSRVLRYRRGKSDPQGFFEDSYNYPMFRETLIDPFRAGASSVSTARFDHVRDAEITRTAKVETASLLVIDGIFLHRDELAGIWDFSIFLSVPFAVSYARMAKRNGSNPDPLATENRRYYEGQQIYIRTCQPEKRATVVLDNSDIDATHLVSGHSGL